MAASPESVIKDLQNRKYAPVYFLQGEEPYYIDLISDNIEKNCLSESEKGFNQTVLYGKDANMNTILLNAKRFPMMSERQVVIVKEAQEISDLGKEAGDKQLEAYIQNPLPSTVLVFAHKYKSLDGRKGLAKTVDKFAILVNSKKMYDNQLPDWVVGYLTSKNHKVSPKAAVMIADYIGNNLSRIANEMDKLLINLKPGEEVNEDLVEKHVGISKEYNVFELQKALIMKDVLKANRIVNYFDANPKNNPLIPIVTVLFNFFSKLLLLHGTENKSEDNVVKILGINKFFLKDYTTAARAYSVHKAVNIIHSIRKADMASKGIDSVSSTEGQILKELVFAILH